MPYFKFMPHGRVDSVLDGSLYLKSLRYFRLLEYVTGDLTIGDQEEATANTLIPYFDGGDEKLRKLLEEKGVIRFEGSGNSVVATNLTVIEHVDCYVYCLSDGELDSLASIKDQYNSGIRIRDGMELANRIAAVGLWKGAPVAEHFHVQAGLVDYSRHDHNYDQHGFGSPSPFIKRATYRDQSEFRVVLIPRSTLEDDQVVLDIGDCRDIFYPLGIWPEEGGNIASAQSNTDAEKDQALGKLKKIIEDDLTQGPGTAGWRQRWLDESAPETIDRRREMIEQYWRLRNWHPSIMVDQFLLANGPTRILPFRLRMYLSSAWSGV